MFIIPTTTAKAASAVWDGTAASGFASGSGTESAPYIIKTAQQLAFLRNQVNGDNAILTDAVYEDGEFSKPECVLTLTIADDNSYTATITPVEGAEYSFSTSPPS